MFDKEWPDDGLVHNEEADVQKPEQQLEEPHVHIVVVTIIDKSSIRVFQEDKPTEISHFP